MQRSQEQKEEPLKKSFKQRQKELAQAQKVYNNMKGCYKNVHEDIVIDFLYLLWQSDKHMHKGVIGAVGRAKD